MKENLFTHNPTQRSRIPIITLFVFICLVILLLSLKPTPVGAGVYGASSSTTYKEYWVDKSEFTGGFVKPVESCETAEHTNPWGSHYLEPWPCHKTMEFEIPDNFSQALKAEIYLDLWRNHAHGAARFKINDGDTYSPNVGGDWSRTPWISEIDLNELVQGTNSIEFWNNNGGYHVHDMAIRIYYDNANPLSPGSGSDVTPSSGTLLTVAGDGAAVAAGTGGTLTVNNNQLTLTADVAAGAKFVEFHGYYFGYDEDNNGLLTDWHSRTHHSWHPGGEDKPTGGTIDHAGSVAATSAGQYSVTWDISHIPDQAGMKFKIRVVDASGNVNDAAGGSSANFAIQRTQPLVAFYDPLFKDGSLWMEGQQPLTLGRRFFFPPSVTNDFVAGKFVHSFWGFPRTSINGQTAMWPNYDIDYWTLSKRDININHIAGGTNTLTYLNNTTVNNPGEFIERPGPMFVLKRKASVGVDNKAPELYGKQPGWNSDLVDPSTPVTLQLYDIGSGVDTSTVVMNVKEQPVSPSFVGTKHNYAVIYNPTELFVAGEEVPVEISACDFNGNCMTDSYSFTIKSDVVESIIQSDDFNSCTLDTNRWEFVNPLGDATYKMTGENIQIELPAGTTHDAWVVNNGPRIMQAANDTDFSVKVKYDSVVSEAMQVQGLIVEEDAQNYLRFNVRYFADEVRLEAFKISNGAGFPAGVQILANSPQYFSLVRTQNNWKFYASDDGINWNDPLFVQHEIEVSKIGAFVGNAPPTVADPEDQVPAFTGDLDFFFNGADPIDPEDANPLLLAPVVVDGQGTVEKNPECGNPVTLTAVPEAGWSFDNWESLSGTINGATNPLNTPFTHGEQITATFTLDEYTLDVDVVNNGVAPGGSVSISPQQDIYLHDEEVTLTANVPAGWEFLGWSGDVLPSEENLNPLPLTMTDDRDITATFSSVHAVTLEVASWGAGGVGGTATLTPDQASYYYGDEITLSATPATGWGFKRWEGAGLSPTQAALPLVSFEVTEAMDVTAIFAEYVTLTIEPSVGNGSVEVDPDENIYLWNDTVALTAVPAADWYFSHWEGDITGFISENPKSISLDGSKSVKAVFIDHPPTLYNYLPIIRK